MTKLSDIQAVILSAAAQRDDGAVLPLPETLKIRGGAVDKVLGSLKAKGLIDRRGAGRGDNPAQLRITRAGLEAIGVEPEHGGESAAVARAPATQAGGATPAKKSKRAKGSAPGDTRPAIDAARTRRAPTKQALMIELLKRPEGATVEHIAAATGWQHHTIRGAISGALRKKLGLIVETIRTREVGPSKAGAKGSSTVYRIAGSDPEAGPPRAVG